MTYISINFVGDLEISFFKIMACDGFYVHVNAGNPDGYM